MANSLDLNFNNNPNAVFYPNQVVAGNKKHLILQILDDIDDFLSSLGTVVLKLVDAVKARGKSTIFESFDVLSAFE